jgi:hypothetical protein
MRERAAAKRSKRNSDQKELRRHVWFLRRIDKSFDSFFGQTTSREEFDFIGPRKDWIEKTLWRLACQAEQLLRCPSSQKLRHENWGKEGENDERKRKRIAEEIYTQRRKHYLHRLLEAPSKSSCYKTASTYKDDF